jgi:lipopolysaccharide export system protein LptC
LKESNEAILNTKNDVIELLKVQVEVLTAKLTELKITDAHIHVDAKMAKE